MDKGMELFFIAIGAIYALTLTLGVVCAAEIFVGPSETYTTIQSAENVAGSDDTIIVRDGIYPENVDVDVAHLTIRSENGSANCIVQAANPNDHVFEVTADWVNISGFTVQGALGYAGIYLFSADHCTISENNASNNGAGAGILLDYSSYNNLKNNTASNNNIGINLHVSSNNNLTDNNASYNYYDGIHLYASRNNNLTNNIASNNPRSGLTLYYSYSNILRVNTASDNSDGIWLFGSRDNNISCNWIHHNSQYGVHLSAESIPNRIESNNIMANGDEQADCSWHYNFYNEQEDNVTAEDNYWGTTSSTVIAASINENTGTVDYEPFLDLPAPCAPFDAPVTTETPEVPILTPIGLIALVSLLAAIAAVAIVRKRR